MKNDDLAIAKKDFRTSQINLKTAIRKDIEEVVSGAVQEVLGAMVEQFDKRDQKIDKLDQKITALDQNLADVDATVNRIESKLDPTIEQVDNHQLRIGHLEQKAA